MKIAHDHILDELLVLNTQNGDMKALSLLVKRWHLPLLKQAYRLTRDSEASLDIVQDSWHAIMKGICKLKDPRAFKTWAFRIVSNKSVNWINQQQKERKLKEDEQIEALGAESKENDSLKKIKIALQEVPQNNRVMLSMFYIDNLSVNDISAIMKVSEGTVKSRLFYARKKLKEAFEKLK